VEAWKKVLIALGSKTSPADLDPHMAMLTCVECHGGNPEAMDDMEAAHTGLIKDPSAPQVGACDPCHRGIATTAHKSMHATLLGERNVLAQRYGVSSFEECPAKAREGYEGECTSCHATCGDCHISRPNSAGRGLIKNHVIQKKPHQLYQCMGCHGARIGEDFKGDEESGRKPDTHFARGMSCMSCHDGDEMHADATGTSLRWDAPGLPQCEDCHGDDRGANDYHLMHWNDLACYTCHSQPYSNCQGCHVAGEYHDDPVYQAENPFLAFRIGLNPLENRRFKYGLLRHAPMAPDSFDPWGAPRPEAFDAVPTWKYTAPHSIQRWTERTKVTTGADCGTNCHLGEPGGSAANRGLYLFLTDVQAGWPDEVDANLPVIVDEALPDSWK
jgi:thiosulfate/3-mercaptopyruvate sulfurtransferase